MRFLSSPSVIRHSLAEAIKENNKGLDLAVAFIGRDWSDIIGHVSGPIRVVCWLSSTNTNPYAVEQMILRGIQVRQLDAMHAKVYLAHGKNTIGIVGSSNLSDSALSEDDASGQYETAIEVRDENTLDQINHWFAELWSNSKKVKNEHIEKAKKAWIHARKSNKRKHINTPTLTPIPAEWSPSKELKRLADSVRNIDLNDHVSEYQSVIRSIEADGGRKYVENLIDFVSSWTGHKAKFYPALDESPTRIRQAFRTLFNNGISLEERLRYLDNYGDKKINGFGLNSLTMILSWRYPEECPPLNRRTFRFLEDFGFDKYMTKTTTPNNYGRWIAFAQDLSARLQLPFAGHIDRIVWEHTKDLDL